MLAPIRLTRALAAEATVDGEVGRVCYSSIFVQQYYSKFVTRMDILSKFVPGVERGSYLSAHCILHRIPNIS